jgi:hypothetical protein
MNIKIKTRSHVISAEISPAQKICCPVVAQMAHCLCHSGRLLCGDDVKALGLGLMCLLLVCGMLESDTYYKLREAANMHEPFDKAVIHGSYRDS